MTLEFFIEVDAVCSRMYRSWIFALAELTETYRRTKRNLTGPIIISIIVFIIIIIVFLLSLSIKVMI
jgi:ABC-type multidrug transport system permease subunit